MRRRSRGIEQTETNVLEVDVVRFMAIVGLTLMVIFALVQSLPYHGDVAELEEFDGSPPPPDPETVTMPVEDYDVLVNSRQQAEQQLERLERKAAAANDPPAPEQRPPARSETASADTLVLRFRDDDVYLHLLEAAKIQSFVSVPDLGLTYKVIPGHRDRLGLSLVYGLEAERLYRIPDVVVPSVLRQAIRSFDFKLAQRSDLVTLVVLSDDINAQVDRLRGAGRTGDFDILADERVVPKE